MSFLHPEFIYMMLPFLVILFAMLTTQADLKAQIFSAEILEKLRVESDQFSTRTRNIFFLLMFIFIILALAEPVVKQGEVWLDEEDVNYYILIDSHIEDPQKVQRTLKHVINKYDLSLGIIILGSQDYLLSSATKDKNYLFERVDVLDDFYEKKQAEGLYFSSTLQSFLDHENRQAFLISDAVLTKAFKNIISRYDVTVIESDKSEKFHKYLETRVEANKPKALYFHIFIIPIALAMFMFIMATSSFYRGEKHFVPLLLFSFLIFSPKAEATVFSFEKLKEAQSFYEKGDYEACAKQYYRYALAYESKEATYNAANCYYHAGQYERAVSLYQSIAFVDREKEYNRYFNLAGALVKQGDFQALLKARSVYLKAKNIYKTKLLEEKLEAVNLQLSQRKRAYKRRNVVVKREGSAEKTVKSENSDTGDEVLERRLREANNKHIYLLKN